MKTLFIDTNVLLQCRDLKELAWQEIADGEDILMLISSPVQGEIDHLKHDGNTRRARRARKANSFIRQLILKEPARIILRESCRVEAARLPAMGKLQEHPLLDLSRTDDRIIAEAMRYRDCHQNENVALLTHDTQPLGTAKDCGLPVVVVPDSWLLEPEPDERDKKIVDLESRVRNLEHRTPDIKVSANDADDTPLKVVTINIQRYVTLSKEQVDEFVNTASSKYPVATSFEAREQNPSRTSTGSLAAALGGRWEYEPASAEKIESYRESYAVWQETVRRFFESLPSRLESPSRHFKLSLEITNQGAAPAEDLRLEFELAGGLVFASEIDAAPVSFPNPPKPPEGKWILRSYTLDALARHQPFSHDLTLPGLSAISGFRPTAPRDKYAFYWRTPKGAPSNRRACECDGFRHKVRPTILTLDIFAPPGQDLRGGQFTCGVTAKNLPEPVLYTLPIKITEQEEDTLSVARGFVASKRIFTLSITKNLEGSE
jgi:predicted nucleic acid-binding protein